MSLFNFGGFTWLWETINGLMLVIINLLYGLISLLYRVFVAVAKVNLFDRETFSEITSRIYVIMGIAMLFIFAYNIILMIINPDDKKSTGNTTKVVKETMISLVLVILLPTIFNYLYIFQNHVLDSNIIGQVILGPVGSTSDNSENCDPDDYDCTCDFSSYNELGNIARKKQWYDYLAQVVTIGLWDPSNSNDVRGDLKDMCNHYKTLNASTRGAYSVAPTLISAFYKPTHFTINDCVDYLQGYDDLDSDEDKQICANYFYNLTASKYLGDVSPFVMDTYLRNIVSDDSKDSMELNWLLAIIAGVVAGWMFLCYAMELGVRVAKLAVLQIISPIAVMMRIIPKQKEAIFDKWLKNLQTTYLDVFIRLMIIYFALFAISLVPNVIETLFASVSATEGGFIIKTLALVFVILGILKFAQEAPSLLKEFFGSGGSFALKSPKKQLTDNKYAMAGLGMVGGGLTSAASNLINAKGAGKITSAVGGLFGGAKRGLKYGGEAKDIDSLKRAIKTSKEESDSAREKHKAIRADGKINGKEIPVISGIWGQAQHTWKDVKEGAIDFKDFLFGNVASTELGNAANTVMVDVDNMEADFSNANIANIKSGRSEIMKKFNNDEEFDFNGKHYRKIDSENWTDGTKNSDGSDYTVSSELLGKQLADAYKDRLAKAYANNEMKDGILEGFKRANESMLKDLRDAMPKFGDEFSTKLFDKLNKLKDANGIDMNLNVHSLDELEDRMKSMMNESNDALREANLASIYKINDEIKSMAKGVKISNDQALKAQAANKDKKDK